MVSKRKYTQNSHSVMTRHWKRPIIFVNGDKYCRGCVSFYYFFSISCFSFKKVSSPWNCWLLTLDWCYLAYIYKNQWQVCWRLLDFLFFVWFFCLFFKEDFTILIYDLQNNKSYYTRPVGHQGDKYIYFIQRCLLFVKPFINHAWFDSVHLFLIT